MTKRLLVCDLDNTLYDWVGYFVPAFYAMVDEVVRLTGCDRERLLDDFREVHRKHHDSEHPFALLETRTVLELFPGRALPEVNSTVLENKILSAHLHPLQEVRNERKHREPV